MSDKERVMSVFTKYISDTHCSSGHAIDTSLSFEDLGIDSMKLVEFLIELQAVLKIDLFSLAMEKNKIKNIADIFDIVDQAKE